jgi:ADP-ribose pyrophosphatase YjhB (NUDIX family)
VKTTVVSAAIVREDAGMILLAQRSTETSYSFHWCTPGGKVEMTPEGYESHRDAIARELREELKVELAGELGPIVYEHETESRRVVCYRIGFRNIVGAPQCGDATIGVGWFLPRELSLLQLTPADEFNRDKLVSACRGAS